MNYYRDNMPEGLALMIGKTFINVTKLDAELLFEAEDGMKFTFYHTQDCCENVYIEDVNGDLSDLIGAPMVMAEESTNNDRELLEGREYESFTWTFYKFATNKGSVTVRWLGESNGYYSERVDLEVN